MPREIKIGGGGHTVYVNPTGEPTTEDVQAVIAFTAIPSATVTDANFLVAPTSNSPAPITVISSNPSVATCTSNGNGTWSIDVLAVGTTNIIASQDMTSGYTEAEDAVRGLVVDPVISAGYSFLTATGANLYLTTEAPAHNFTADNSSFGVVLFSQYIPANTAASLVWDIGTNKLAIIGLSSTNTVTVVTGDTTAMASGPYNNSSPGLYIYNSGSGNGNELIRALTTENKAKMTISALGLVTFYVSFDNGATYSSYGTPATINNSSNLYIKAKINASSVLLNLNGTGQV